MTWDAEFELIDDNASVTVPFGTVDGCQEISMSITGDYNTGPDSQFDSTLYWHDDYGIVQIGADGTESFFGFWDIKLSSYTPVD
ncbi:MAG: hypothetical protein M5R36_25140 [Deltaproteobacteria bacterium]|nr:hypothetical protein [Deltaproteobacteria bacterium]